MVWTVLLMLYVDKERHQAKICKIEFQFFHWRPGCTRNCCKFNLFFAVLPSNDNINRITCHEAFMGWKNMRLWRPGENKQAGVRDGERCVNGQVALSLLALFWDNRKNKERGVTDNWRQTATSGINGLVLGHALIQSRGGRGAGCLIMAFFPQFVA